MVQKQKTAEVKSSAPAETQKGNLAAKKLLENKWAAMGPAKHDVPMNREKILEVADAIESASLLKDSVGFNMSHYISDMTYNEHDHMAKKRGHVCGTVACIAGWTTLVETQKTGIPIDEAQSKYGFFGAHYFATKLLGIDSSIAGQLFTPDEFENYDLLTDKRAVAVLRNLVETGKVQWRKFKNDGSLSKRYKAKD